MAVVFDPHQKEDGNLIPLEAVTPVGSKYRLLIPANGPFYSGSVVLTSNDKPMTYGADYVFAHRYLTGVTRTGRNIHGSIWIINDALVNNFKMTSHAVGCGTATAAQIAAERAKNEPLKYPTDCQWEEVIGEVYFPPVDVQFDRDNWQGERELMDKIAAIGKKIAEKPKLPDPFTTNDYTSIGISDYYTRNELVYQNDLSWLVKKKPTSAVSLSTGISEEGYIGDYRLIANYNLPSLVNQITVINFDLRLRSFWGSGFVGLSLRFVDGDLKFQLSVPDGIKTKYITLASAGTDRSMFSKPFTVTVINSVTHDTVSVVVERAGVILMNTSVDINNPPAALAADWLTYNVKAKLAGRNTDIRQYFDVGVNDTFSYNDFPGYHYSADDRAQVLALLKDYAEIVNELYRGAPAHAHILDKNDPHEDTPGSINALPLNDVAFDAAKVFGYTQPQLTDYVNGLLPKLSSLSNRILRVGVNTPVPGAFTMQPGLGQISSTSQANETAGVETLGTVDDKMIRLLSKTYQRHVTTGDITAKSGANKLVLYSDNRGLQWNNKQLLDPITVIPYLPGVSAGGDGLFYGENTTTFTMNGNGISTVPFTVQWLAPSNANRDTSAMRRLTTDFGTSDDLMATPSLLKKLNALFTGKLLLNKATINGLALSSSVTLDKLTFGLGNVSNVADTALQISTLQQQELDKYADVGHTHTPAQLGVVQATDKVKGLVKIGGLVDDATVALDAGTVIALVDRTSKLSTAAGNVDSGAVIDIIRYGEPGNAVIANAVTATGWMVSIKAGKYFVRQRFDIPLGSFNLTELSSAPSNKTYYVYADVVNNAGQYRVSATRLTESDTLTEIGSFTTNDSTVSDSTVRNVTRLGDFREMVDHVAALNDHTHRAQTQAEFGFTFNTQGEEFSGGAKGVLRRDADWRARGINGMRSRENVKWSAFGSYTGFVFQPAGVNAADHLLMQNISPNYGMSDTSITFSPYGITGNDDTLLELMALGFYDKAGNFNRFSLLVSKSNYLTDVNGNASYVGFAVNYGSPKQIIVAAAATPVNPTLSWADINARCVMLATTSVLSWGVDVPTRLNVNYNLATETITFGSESINLTARLDAAGIDRSLMRTADLKRYFGCGGSFSGVFNLGIAVPATMNDTNVYNTLPSFMEQHSALNRVRIVEGVLTTAMLAMTDTQLRTAIVQAGIGNHYGGIPKFISTADLILYTDKVNKRYTAVVIRD